ncbi:MAG TPA: squalene/phytoene synthase family protein [Solirubrobacteraceae bacterium]|jgi:phytoene synthase|nr:squalene/phytoene synthase family protein [Solirubrobacteraceae bacterium]
MSAAMTIDEAYARCAQITRSQAANFYYGIRLLEPPRRRAMCAAYAFARRIDDIGDGNLPRERKRELLEGEAAQLSALEAGDGAVRDSDDAVIVALADAHSRFALPPGAMGELIEGVCMDVDEVSYEQIDELVVYCGRVAGAIGRVCLAIFARRAPADGRAVDRAAAESLADDLGVALQLTNILRDVREDAQLGRVYLPAEDLRRFGVIAADGSAEAGELLAALDDPVRRDALDALVRFEAQRAQQWFSRGLPLVDLLDRRSAACVRAMSGIYHRLLGQIEADPAAALAQRASLSTAQKARVALRSLAGRNA